MAIFRNKHESASPDRPLVKTFEPSPAQVKRATRTRLGWALVSSLLLLISVVFLILVEIGNTSVNHTRNDIYFINLNLTNVVPLSVPDATLINSIAQTIGLHDFYTVGLWDFCEGYNGEGVTQCSKPQALYWFNPVEILQNELLSGATIALPADITNILGLIRIASKWMFGLFMAGVCLNFVMIFLNPLSVKSRWATLPIMILTFFGALCTTAATIVATVMFIIMKDEITSQQSLDIGAKLGVEMFAFMWIAAGTAVLAWVIQLCLTCCCASRRDVWTGRKRGSRHAWDGDNSGMSEKRSYRRGFFGRKQ